ncbi:MAG: signal recognition particle-docking protein FtsY [Alphaproteobacteria bacterium]|nr:signal recognition particle-docking protein FtsY [Alphaproteobacteria bacterium]
MSEATAEKPGWLSRLRAGLHRSSGKLGESIASAFTKRKLDAEALEELEELLIAADLGPTAAAGLVADFGKSRFGKDVTDQEVREALAESIAALLEPYAKPLEIDAARKPFVVLMVGVNGSGKTTTIGKMARRYHEEGLKTVLAAGDTFRAAATSQLQVWGERARSKVVAGEPNSDAAALVFQALQQAKADKVDVLLVDTAGRLQNKTGLMEELAKIARVLKKIDPEAPHATLLVLDATTGQNAHSQVEIFREMTNVTGLILTKLDGSAKGGVVVALADRFHLPIHLIGVGERADDLRPFDAKDFAQSLLGLDEA